MNASNRATATIDPAESRPLRQTRRRMVGPEGSSAMLHRLNPVRLGYIRGRIDAHWHGDRDAFAPLAGVARWTWAAARGCWPNHWPGSARR